MSFFFFAFVLHRVIVRRSLTFWPDESSYAKLGLEIGCMTLLNRDRADLVGVNSQGATRAL